MNVNVNPDTVKKRNDLNFAQRVEILKYLESICIKGEDGLAEYLKPWTDRTVADTMSAELGTRVTRNNIVEIRREMIGSLRTARASQPEKNDLEQRVAELEREVATLRALVKFSAPPRPVQDRLV